MSRAYNFHSTDLGAPTLSGVAGAGITLLDALLINGYGVTSVSGITCSGGTVTVTTGVDHGKLFEDVIEIAGADQTDYNGKWKVLTVPTSKTLTFDIGVLTPVTPATGTITVKKAGLGWTKAFSGTNRAAYKMPIGSNGFYLYVDDTTTTYMSVRIYETMSDIDTGTNPTPATTSVWNKSSTADSTTRPWAAYGEDYWLWFAPCYNAASSTRAAVFGAGDLIKTISTDAYATAIIGCTSTSTTGPDVSTVYQFLVVNAAAATSAQSGHYLVRDATQTGSAVGAGKTAICTGGFIGFQGYLGYDVTVGVMLTDIFMHDVSVPQMRGKLPCVKAHMHLRTAYNPSTYTRLPPVPGLSGHTLESCTTQYNGSASTIFFDLTDSGR